MQDYRVQLDVFHGPLDLLLYLIKREEVDIHDIPIAQITDQYLRYVAGLQALDVDLAGDFLVMAATLMEIKSAVLIPPDEASEQAGLLQGGDGEAEDPRYELVQQLLAYKQFKDAAGALQRRRERFSAQFPRQPPPFQPRRAEVERMPELDLEDLSVWDLLEAFTTLMEQVGGPPRVDLVQDDTPIDLHATDILDRLQRDGPTVLQELFLACRTTGEMVGLFLATLELLRERKIRVTQESLGGPIRLCLREEEEADSGEIELPEVDPEDPDAFEWPDEPTRRRYLRRVERRRRGERVEEDEQFEQDIAELERQEQDLPADASGSG